MKRTCSILLALVMLLSLCACGSTPYGAVSQSSRLESAPAAMYDTAVSAETVNADFGGFGMTAEASAGPDSIQPLYRRSQRRPGGIRLRQRRPAGRRPG